MSAYKICPECQGEWLGEFEDCQLCGGCGTVSVMCRQDVLYNVAVLAYENDEHRSFMVNGTMWIYLLFGLHVGEQAIMDETESQGGSRPLALLKLVLG